LNHQGGFFGSFNVNDIALRLQTIDFSRQIVIFQAKMDKVPEIVGRLALLWPGQEASKSTRNQQTSRGKTVKKILQIAVVQSQFVTQTVLTNWNCLKGGNKLELSEMGRHTGTV
jgi:hypothetical protein